MNGQFFRFLTKAKKSKSNTWYDKTTNKYPLNLFESQSDKLYLRRSNMSRVGEINPK